MMLMAVVRTMNPRTHTQIGTAGNCALRYEAPISHTTMGRNM